MNSFRFSIGDLLKVRNVDWISPAGCPEKQYTHSLRVAFRFWDGKDNVYVVTAEDGLGMFVVEGNAELQEAASDAVVPEAGRAPQDEEAEEERYSLTRDEMLEFAQQMTFSLDDRLVPLSREALRSDAWLQGFVFAKAHK